MSETKYDMVVEITPEELSKLIAAKVSSDLGSRFSVDPSKISFTVTNQTQGYGPAEHDVTVFGGAKVKADFIPPTNRFRT